MSVCLHRVTATGAVDRQIPQSIPAVEFRRLPNRSFNRRRRIVIRSLTTTQRNLWIVEAVGGRGMAAKSDGYDRDGSKTTSCSYSIDDGAVEGLVEKKGCGEVSKVQVVAAAAITVVLGVGNRVLYKLALVPLKNYPFFLAQLATFGYVVVYFSILYLRHHAGIVTDEMLSVPKAPFAAVGFLEALAAASGMAAATMLSGASIPILSQTFLVWQLLLSVIFLGRRYRVNELFGCFLVSIGVVVTVASGSSAGLSLKESGIFWSLLMIFSFFLQAADTVLKEVIFLDAAERLKGGSVDLFVVNSFGSVFQTMFICLLLPFLSKLWGIPFTQLPSYIRDGTACFLNLTSSTGCDGAPLLPVLFVIVNMGYNISLLHLIKISSAVVSCLASTITVPLSVLAFTFPLPYLGVGSALPPGFMAGGVILVMGLLIYTWRPTAVPARATSP